MNKINSTIAKELEVKESQVEAAVKLIYEGNTIPFIARYRKEATGGLSDETLRDLGERLTYLRNLEQRKEEVVKSIEEQGKLTDEIIQAVAISKTLAEVEDIYRPYKQKKKTRATVAKAKGLEPLAEIIIEQKETTPIEEIAKQYINIENLSEEDKKNKDKVVKTAEEAIQGALDIIAENISDNSKYRKEIKRICYREAQIETKATDEEKKSNYEMYYDKQEPIKYIPSHKSKNTKTRRKNINVYRKRHNKRRNTIHRKAKSNNTRRIQKINRTINRQRNPFRLNRKSRRKSNKSIWTELKTTITRSTNKRKNSNGI